jgi:ribosomal protein S26
LIGEMAAAQTLAHQPLRHSPAYPACPRCNGPVRVVHNQTRWGKSQQLECAQRHGAYQSFAQFLSEKGLLRPMGPADRQRALQRDGALHCVNCGGAVGQADTTCSWCRSVPSVFDVARLAQALDPEGATRQHAVHGTQGRAGALACQACGAALPADAGWSCPQCQATVTAAGLAEAHRIVSELGPALKAHAEKPAPHVVQQRLAAQDGGLNRQRERAREMQAEADAQRGRSRPDPVDAADAVDLLATVWRVLRGWWH